MSLRVRFVAGVLRLGGLLPLSILHALGAGLARAMSWAGSREYRVAKRNVELCFPELAPGAARRFLRTTLTEAGKGTLELAALWGRAPSHSLKLIRAVEGRAELDAALAQGRGLLIAAPHLGAWELLNLYLSSIAPISILYRVPQRPEFEPLMNAARGALGAEPIRADPHGVRLLYRRLRAGGMVGILPDQRPKGGEGVEAPFFGHSAKTMTLLSRLAHKTGAAVMLGFAERLPLSAGFRIHFLPGEPGIAAGDSAHAAAALNRGIEQYQWTYKRFSFHLRSGDPMDRIYQ
jgi:KDO2-lipid IV(A) lauroyltransferase